MSRMMLSGLVACLCLTSIPAARAYEPELLLGNPSAVDSDVDGRSSPSAGLTIAGLSLFSAAYTPAGVIGFLSLGYDHQARSDFAPLALPIAGALYTGISTMTSPEKAASDIAFVYDIYGAIMLVDGVAQAAGVVMAIVGMSSKAPARTPSRISLLPASAPGYVGMMATGRF